MLIEILDISSVVVNALLSLSQSMNLLPVLPGKIQFSSVRHMVCVGHQVFHQAPLAVHGLYTLNDRLLPACGIHLHRGIDKLLSYLLQKQRTIRLFICDLPGVPADFQTHIRRGDLQHIPFLTDLQRRIGRTPDIKR